MTTRPDSPGRVRWTVVSVISRPEVHVIPRGRFVREHDLTPECWCKPAMSRDAPEACPLYTHRELGLVTL